MLNNTQYKLYYFWWHEWQRLKVGVTRDKSLNFMPIWSDSVHQWEWRRYFGMSSALHCLSFIWYDIMLIYVAEFYTQTLNLPFQVFHFNSKKTNKHCYYGNQYYSRNTSGWLQRLRSDWRLATVMCELYTMLFFIPCKKKWSAFYSETWIISRHRGRCVSYKVKRKRAKV